jgi:hypothetical protein
MNSPTSNNVIGSPLHGNMPASLDDRINRALEHKPEPQIAAEFAARVAARALAQPLRRRRSAPQFGKLMALVCAVLSACALFALAPHASAANIKNLSFDAEVILLAELAFIGLWLARVSAGLSDSR